MAFLDWLLDCFDLLSSRLFGLNTINHPFYVFIHNLISEYAELGSGCLTVLTHKGDTRHKRLGSQSQDWNVHERSVYLQVGY